METCKAVIGNLVGGLGLDAIRDKWEGEASVLDSVLMVRNCLEWNKAVDKGLRRSSAAVAVVIGVVKTICVKDS